MNRGRPFSKMSGGFLKLKISDKPHVELQVHKDVMDPHRPVIIEPPPKHPQPVGMGTTEKPLNRDPASRLRKLAMKSKKILIGNGRMRPLGGKYKLGNEPEGTGKGLEKYLGSLPIKILATISRLHHEGILGHILGIKNHI